MLKFPFCLYFVFYLLARQGVRCYFTGSDDHSVLVDKYIEDAVPIWKEMVDANEKNMRLEITPKKLTVFLHSERFGYDAQIYFFNNNRYVIAEPAFVFESGLCSLSGHQVR